MVGGGAGAPASSHEGFGGSSYSGDGPVGILGDGHARRIEGSTNERSESAKSFLTRSFYY
jgi:hypothetical protein